MFSADFSQASCSSQSQHFILLTTNKLIFFHQYKQKSSKYFHILELFFNSIGKFYGTEIEHSLLTHNPVRISFLLVYLSFPRTHLLTTSPLPIGKILLLPQKRFSSGVYLASIMPSVTLSNISYFSQVLIILSTLFGKKKGREGERIYL